MKQKNSVESVLFKVSVTIALNVSPMNCGRAVWLYSLAAEGYTDPRHVWSVRSAKKKKKKKNG